MAEWSKATVLKTVESRGSVGSNPTPSASGRAGVGKASSGDTGRGARVAESDRLLSGWGVKSFLEGSNPSLSATFFSDLGRRHERP